MRPASNSIVLSSVTAAVSLLAMACGDDSGKTCGPGTRLEGSACLPICAPGTEADPETARCIAVCLPGTLRDPTSGACLPDVSVCEPGSVPDASGGTCIPLEELCAPDTTWVASEARCVPDEQLREADGVEGSDENDPAWGGPTAFETFAPPSIGETVSLSGRVSAPTDRDHDGWLDPDFDWWVFSVSEPTLLRIEADGLGSSTSGFALVGLELGDFIRNGLGSSSTSVIRDVFLPTGLYALICTDALNFLVDPTGPFRGGGEMGYFVTIGRLELPVPTPLDIAAGSVSIDGVFADRVPSESTSLGFFTLPVEARAAYDLGIGFPRDLISASLTILDGDGFLASAYGGTHGFVRDDELLVVADYGNKVGFVDVPYRVSAFRRPVTWAGDDLPSRWIAQPEWNIGQEVPSAHFGLEVGRDEVLTVRFASSTGRTCIEAWDRHYAFPLGNAGCLVGPTVPPLHVGTIRLLAPESGYSGLTSTDLDGAELDPVSRVLRIPAHGYELSLGIRRQTPEPITLTQAFEATALELTDLDDELYFRMQGARGHALRGRVSGDLDPTATMFEVRHGQLLPAALPATTFAFRSIDGLPTLLGVANDGNSPGLIDLQLEPLVPTPLGPVAVGTSVASVHLSGQGGGEVFRLTGATDGLATIRFQPPGEFDLVVIPRAIDLAPLPQIDRGGPGELETMVGAMGADGLFFELHSATGPIPEAGIDVELEVILAPAAGEAEPNDFTNWGTAIEQLPAAVAGAIDAPGDMDWYRFQADGPVTIVATVLPAGDRRLADTGIALGDRFGQLLALDDDSGPGWHGRAELQLDHPGIFTVLVWSIDSQATGDYLLELAVQP